MYLKEEELPLFMTVYELAKVMRVSSRIAYELVRSEGFPSMRLNRRIIIPKREFLKWTETINNTSD